MAGGGARRGGRRFGWLAWVAAAPALFAQDAPQVPATGEGASLAYGAYRTRHEGDFTYLVLDGYFELVRGDLRVRADRATLIFDRDELQALQGKVLRGGDELPQRGAQAPMAQDVVLGERLRQRAEEGVRAVGAERGGALDVPAGRAQLALLVRAIHAEGNVVFEQRGVRNLRCARLWLSLVSERGVFEEVDLRLPAGTALAPDGVSLVLRSPRAVLQGRRIVARQARLTSCSAGEPHFELQSQRLVVTGLEGVLEVEGEGNMLTVEGLPGLPLPDYRWLSDQENWLPVRGVAAGASTDRGQFVLVELGGRYNGIGQALVDLFAPASTERFRGEWRLRTGYTSKRGAPVDGDLKWSLPGSFAGDLDGFWLDDRGTDRRSVTRELDGTPIDAEQRAFVRGKNRVELDDATRLDAQVFWAGDPAAYSEFRPTQLKEDEQPETSLELRHARDNRRFGLLGRTNLTEFAYDETARLTDSFASQAYATFDVVSQPLVEIAEGMPVVLQVGSGAGYLRNDYDPHSPLVRSESSFRADAVAELSVPWAVGGFSIAPYASARETWYSQTAADPDDGEAREALEAGLVLGTRFSRWFEAQSDLFDLHGLMHDVRPELRVYDRFRVGGEPVDFYQFDAVDSLDEEFAVDVGVLNRLATRRLQPSGTSRIDEIVWLDLVQRFHPDADRDNGGDVLGLFFFEMILSPGPGWLPLPNTRFLFDFERDWDQSEFKTRNLGVAAGPVAGVSGSVGWRSGADGDGTGSFSLGTTLLRRWDLAAGVIYDFRVDDIAATSFRLARRDHDWTLALVVSNDENTNDRSIALRFEPTLGGIVRQRDPRFVGGDPAYGVLNQ